MGRKMEILRAFAALLVSPVIDVHGVDQQEIRPGLLPQKFPVPQQVGMPLLAKTILVLLDACRYDTCSENAGYLEHLIDEGQGWSS